MSRSGQKFSGGYLLSPTYGTSRLRVSKANPGFESTLLRHAVWTAEKLGYVDLKIAGNSRNSSDVALKPDWRKCPASLPRRKGYSHPELFQHGPKIGLIRQCETRKLYVPSNHLKFTHPFIPRAELRSLSAELRQRLLEHSLDSEDADRRARAEVAFRRP